jgi:hypothetical protein
MRNNEILESDDRAALAKIVMTLFGHWQLSAEDQAELLGLSKNSRATLTRYRKGQPIGTSRDQLDRVRYLLNIHKGLRLLFPQQRDLAYRWMRTRNRAFENLTPVDMVKEWGFVGLPRICAYLNHARYV